ncbi:MAG: hypothetical protein LBI48_08710 [Burkholderiaceae bacterium]|nr:hypothetical protein [Burkholderiaceae bacterium]
MTRSLTLIIASPGKHKDHDALDDVDEVRRATVSKAFLLLAKERKTSLFDS